MKEETRKELEDFAMGADDGVVLFSFGFILIWFVLQIIGNWKLFRKAGKPGWHSIIPILNIYDEYDMCWKGSRGILMLIAMTVTYAVSPASMEESGAMMAVTAVAVIVVIYLQIKQSHRLAKAFGKGLGYTIFLIIFDRLARIVLGFGSAKYIGKKSFR